MRIGIGHPGHKDRVTGYVLGNYAKAEIDDLADMLGAIAAEAEWLAKGDDARFMNDVALRLQTEEPNTMRIAPLMLAIAAALTISPAQAKPDKTEKRCGYLANPTPANWWLTDHHGEWTIGVQGGYQAEGLKVLPESFFEQAGCGPSAITDTAVPASPLPQTTPKCACAASIRASSFQ